MLTSLSKPVIWCWPPVLIHRWHFPDQLILLWLAFQKWRGFVKHSFRSCCGISPWVVGFCELQITKDDFPTHSIIFILALIWHEKDLWHWAAPHCWTSHSSTAPAWRVSALLIILLPSQHQPLAPCPPSLAGQALLLWAKNLSESAEKRFVQSCLSCVSSAFLSLEGVRIEFHAWRSTKLSVCFLLEMVHGISLSYFQVVKLLFPIKIWGKNYPLKIPARWGFWCNLIHCSFYFLCG